MAAGLLLLLLAPLSLAQAPTTAPASQPVYEYRPASRDGIGKFYLGREIAHYMSHVAADWLERPEREQEERPAVLLSALELQPAHSVADIGAGSGYHAFRIARLVPQGKVFAVDIQPEMLDLIKKRAAADRVTNVHPILGTPQSPNLPPASIDLALLVDAYHEFDHPREMMLAIAASLKPGGRVVLVEYRGEDPAVPIKPLHKMTEAQAIKELSAAGLQHRQTKKDLPWQHILIFTRPDK